jgi:hypothetical protein
MLVLYFLPVEEVFGFARVSKNCRQLVEEQWIWRKLTEKYYPEGLFCL